MSKRATAAAIEPSAQPSTPPPAPPSAIRDLPLVSIVPSKSNPRKTFDEVKLQELAESIQPNGVQSPILVRPTGSGPDVELEIVYGERRWRAAKIAGLEVIPARVQELTDEQAELAALVENGERTDIDEYEEADAFQRLRDVHHHSPEEIAAKLGKGIGTVYERLKLASLDKKARDLAQKHEVSPSTAAYVARIHGADRQFAAIKAIAEQKLPFREARAFVLREYMLRLADAPFDVTDAALVPAAGSCSACPKRSGAQRELFAEASAKKDDLCLDAACHRGKVDAQWKLRADKAREAGQTVIEGAAAKKIFHQYEPGRLGYSAPFKKLDDKVWRGDKQVEVRKLLGKDAPPPVLARDPEGNIHELVPQAEVDKKLPKEKSYSSGASVDAAARKRLAARKLVVAAAMPKIVEAGASKKLGAFLLHVATEMIDGGHRDAVIEVAKRRGIEPEKVKRTYGAAQMRYEEPLLRAAAKLDEAGRQGLIVELLASGNSAGGSYSTSFGFGFERAATFAGVDLKKLAETTKKEAAEKKAAPRVKKLTADAACAIPGCGEPTDGKRQFCTSHASKLSAEEQKSILERSKKLAAAGKLPGIAATPVGKKSPAKKPTVKPSKKKKKK